MLYIIFGGTFLALIILFIVKSINVLQPNEMGKRVFLGKPGETVQPGLHITIWPLERIERYTKNILEFSFTVPSIMTKRGYVSGYGEPIETTEMDIECTVYAYFDENKLDDTIEKAPGKTAPAIGPALVPYVVDIVRTLAGRIPWRLVNQERRAFALNVLHRMVPITEDVPKIKPEIEQTEAEKRDELPIYFFDADEFETPLREDQLKESPFVQFGLKDVAFAIEDINFTEEALQKAVSEPEKARLEGTAKVVAARAEKTKRQLEGEGSADARRKMIEAIKDTPELEYLSAFRDAAQGESNTILYQLPHAFESKFKNMLGGNHPSELLRMMNPQDREKLINEIDKILKQRGKKK